MKRSRSYEEHLLEALKDPEEAAAYINAAMEDEDIEVFLLALRDVAKARGGVATVAKKADLNRESLYKSLSKKGNPRWKSLVNVLETCGLSFRVTPLSQKLSESSLPNSATDNPM